MNNQFMNDTDGIFRSVFGVDLGTVRMVWGICLAAMAVLYLYRLITVMHCMRSPLDRFTTPMDRLIWVGLAMLVPLGLGAYLYDIALRRQPFRLLFLIPFSIIAFCAVIFGIPAAMRMTNFKFDFLGV